MRRFFLSLHLYYKTTFYKKKKPFGNLSKEPRRIVSSIGIMIVSFFSSFTPTVAMWKKNSVKEGFRNKNCL
jgi:hypothetical protein